MGRRVTLSPRLAAIGLLGLVILSLGPAQAQTTPPSATADTTDLDNLQSRFQSVADRVSPSVVAISASLTADLSPSDLRSQQMTGEKLQDFLSKTTRMVGTGFVVAADGYILTNDHVIDDAQQLWITTDDKKIYPAIVVGSDPRSDLAVLKIPATNLPAVHFGDGTHVKRGQWSVAIGNPYGLSADGEMCVSVGVVSAVNRSLQKLSDKENRLYLNLIQTTAQINPGNSGGPLFDLNGDVIGINTAVIMPQKSTNGIGFALPIDLHLLSIVDDLKAGKEIVYGYLGVMASTPTERDRNDAGLKDPIGVRVDSVEPDSPAIDGKLKTNDIVVSIDGATVSDSDQFIRLIGQAPITRPVQLDILRDGKPARVAITLHKRQLPVAAVTRDNQRMRWGGMLVGKAPLDVASSGLMVFDIDPTSPFTRQGIHEGTVIQSVAGKSVNAVIDLQNVINDTPPEKWDLGTANLSTAAINP
jgi:serine protease Do